MKILFYVIIALQLLTLFSCANEQLVGHWEQDKNSIHLYNGEILTINHAIFKKGGSGIMWSVFLEDSTSSIGTVDLINWEHINENQISIHSEYWADTIKYKINKDTLFVMDNGGESIHLAQTCNTCSLLLCIKSLCYFDSIVRFVYFHRLYV